MVYFFFLPCDNDVMQLRRHHDNRCKIAFGGRRVKAHDGGLRKTGSAKGEHE